MFRDFIYFNTDKIESIIAQLNQGLIKEIVESDDHKVKAELSAKTGVLAKMLGLDFTGKGGYEFSRQMSDNKSLHDYAFNMALDDLGKRVKDVSNLDREAVRSKNFVKIKGKLQIYDYNDLKKFMLKFDAIGDLFKLNDTGDAPFSEFSKFIDTVYGDLTVLQITNSKDIGFIGVVDNKYMRETLRNLIFKYGSNPNGDWEMVCQVTRVPSNSKNSIDDIFGAFGKSLDTSEIGNGKSLGDFMNKVVEEFGKLYDAFASVSYPNISVEPIGVYRSIE